MKTSFNDSKANKLKVIFLWALLPVVLFACAIPMTNWFASENGVNTDNNYADIAWGKVIASSPDVVFQDVDSIKYYGWELRLSLKKDSVNGAFDATHLFPESGVRKLTILDKGRLEPTFQVWNDNNTVYCGWIARQRNGEFILKVTESGQPKIVPIGNFVGRITLPIEHGIAKPITTMNVVVIVTLLLCVLGLGLGVTAEGGNPGKDWLVYVSGWSAALPLIYVGLWVLGAWSFKGSIYDYPEWIALAWIISEIGLLSGVVFRLSDYEKIEPKNIFERNKDKLGGITLAGEWIKECGDDRIIINGDGSMVYSTSEGTSKFKFQIGDDGSIIVEDANSQISILDYEVCPYSPTWKPLIRISFNGECFTKGGDSFLPAATAYKKEGQKNDVRRTLAMDYGIPESEGSWGWVIFGSICAIYIGTIVMSNIIALVKNDIFAGLFLCAIMLSAVVVVIRNLWLILVGRRRKSVFNKLFDQAYSKLTRDELTEYIWSGMKNPSLSVEEWKSKKNE
ncbi:MAG: hypothetical protein K2K82_09605 [Muribaculaceae bacterium]|nr:hypothetical protein [Muribaculaceae bacterium]